MGNRLLILSFFFVAAMGYAQGTYKLADASVLTISGTSTIHDWTVTANTLQGSLSYTDAIQDVKLTVPVADIKSERGAAMDKKMYEALKQEENPEILFSFQEANAGTGTVSIKGKLKISGMEREVDLKSEITAVDKGYNIKGSQDILLQDYGMTPPTAMFGQIVVGDKVTVHYDLTFVP